MFIFLLVVIIIGLIAAITTLPITRCVAQKSFPQVDGEIQLSGLDGPVDIYRDSFGVPHIFAASGIVCYLLEASLIRYF